MFAMQPELLTSRFCIFHADNSRENIALKRLLLVAKSIGRPRLFGPFGLWAHAVHPDKSPRHAAYLRMVEVHRLAVSRPEMQNEHIREATGWFQDSHVPLATLYLDDAEDDPEMHEVYRRRLDPEGNFSVDKLRESRNFVDALRLAWGCYGIVPDPSPEAGEKILQVISMLLKGMPQPVSIRYILGKLEGLAVSGGLASTVVRDLLLKHFTGSHRGRSAMCTPARRCELMRMTALNLTEEASQYNSRQLYTILAEYVVKMARFDPLAWDICMTRYPRFAKKICAVTIEHNDVPATSPSVHCPLGAAATTGLLMVRNILKVKKKVPASAVQMLSPAQVDRAVTLGRKNRCLSAAALVAAGISRERALSMIVVVKKKADVQRLLESMTAFELAVLACYVAGVVKSGIVVVPLPVVSLVPQLIGGLNGGHDLGQSILFCENCQKPLPKSKAIVGGPKATAGCTVDIDNFSVSCVSCGQYNGIRAIGCVGNLVVARIKVTGQRESITACSECFHPCSPIRWRGTAPRCIRCDEKKNLETAPCFIAGCKKAVLPKPHCLQISPVKSVRIFACARHTSRVESAGPHRSLRDVKTWTEPYKRGRGGRFRGPVRQGKRKWLTHQ